MEAGARSPHVAMLASPGMGHLIPTAELAKRLVLHHGFSVTFITIGGSSSKAQDSLLQSLPSSITSLTLPAIALDDLPASVRIETRLCVNAERSVPAVRDALRSLQKTTWLVAFVTDLFGFDALPVARELGVAPYLYVPSNLFLLSFLLHVPALHAATSCEYRDLPEPVRLPGCVPLHGRDFVDPIQDRTDEAYQWIVHMAKRFREANGILVNTYEDMEPRVAKLLKERESGRPIVYPIGPLIRTSSTSDGDDDGWECLKWLDEQPRELVLFVSFGSGGTLSTAQIRELALGLEHSGQRFLWVVRSPSDEKADSAYFSTQTASDPFGFLPEGFVERTKGVGLLVPSWAPQVRVLAHGATGGFLSHCGWNSTLESVVHGVPMIAWPLYAEQRMNAVMLEHDTHVALRPKAREDGLVERAEICKVVKALMEGEEGKAVRNRVRELQEAAAQALAEEGSSYKALEELANKWKNSEAR